MATLKRLINGQDISFDTHQAGDGQAVNWRDVHLEKRPKNMTGKARFPLVGEKDEGHSSGMSKLDFEKIRREVKRELKKNEFLVKELAETIVEVLRRFSQGNATHSDVIDAAKRFAKYFDLDENFIEYTERYAKKKLVSVSTYHMSKDTGFMYMINQSRDSVIIERKYNYIIP